MSDVKIPEDLRELYNRAKNSWQYASWNADEVVPLIERIAEMEAERDAFKQKFESMRDINDANLECYNNCALENRALRAQVERLTAAAMWCPRCRLERQHMGRTCLECGSVLIDSHASQPVSELGDSPISPNQK